MTKVKAPRVYVDTMIFILAYESDDLLGADLRKLFEVFRKSPKTAVTSELTLAELTINPASPHRFYHDLLISSAFIELRPVTRSVLLDLRPFRKASGRTVKLPDAIHCVTAVQARCDHMLSADKRLPIPSPLTRIYPDHEGLWSLIEALDA